jgi:hypothetical protein
MIKILLEREKVNYYVEGELVHDGLGPMRIMVDMGRAEEIKNALRDELGLK